MTYRTWPKFLPEEYEICAVQLPGRETRLMEPAYKRLLPMIADLALALRPYLDLPFAFFGHSMGGKIAFEVARYVRAEYGLEPFHLFVSGCCGPQMLKTDGILYDLPKAEFIEELRRLNGTPKEVLEHDELMQLMLPLLRADFELVQTYAYSPGPPLRCPVTAFGGLQDTEVTRESLDAWRKETTGSFVSRMLPGDHFFINSERPQLLRSLTQELKRHESIMG
jgi:medium-chain acyl-[acyl-carrier-protein] hydrolase